MYPEVEQFIAAVEAAEAEECKSYEAAQAAYMGKLREAGLEGAWHSADRSQCRLCDFNKGSAKTEKDAAILAGMGALKASREAAWDALKASGDPLVAWIAANCREYEDEAMEVLRALPASMDALDALARERGWCGVWSDFRERAEQAGVLPAQERSEITA